MFSKWKNFVSIPLPEDILSEDDINDIATGNIANGRLFLETYSKEEAERLFEEYDIFPQLRKEGFAHPSISMDTSDPFVHKLQVMDPLLSSKHQESNFLIYLFMRRKNFTLADFKQISSFSHDIIELSNQKKEEEEMSHSSQYDMKEMEAYEFMKKNLSFELKISVIEWLTMQNPLKEFDMTFRPQLPGMITHLHWR